MKRFYTSPFKPKQIPAARNLCEGHMRMAVRLSSGDRGETRKALAGLAVCLSLAQPPGGQLCLTDTSPRDFAPAAHFVMVDCASPGETTDQLNVPRCPKPPAERKGG